MWWLRRWPAAYGGIVFAWPSKNNGAHSALSKGAAKTSHRWHGLDPLEARVLLDGSAGLGDGQPTDHLPPDAEVSMDIHEDSMAAVDAFSNAGANALANLASQTSLRGDNNLQVVDLTDLDGNLPLNVESSKTVKILAETENWEHSSFQNPSWPQGGRDSLGFPSVVKNDRGQNPDGKYYLYYSHHDPTSGIGAAVADSIKGPYIKASVPHSIPILGLNWNDSQVMVNPLYRPNGIPTDWIGHYSSPSVVWNENEQLWFMYFHYYNHYWGGAGGPHWSSSNPGLGHQMTALATTPDLSSHDWTLWTQSKWAQVSVDDTVPVLPTTSEPWMNSQSSYHAIQRLPNGQWLAFLRGTNDATGRPTVGFGTSDDGRTWDYFPENPVIAPGKAWTTNTTEYRPKFIGYLGKNSSGQDEYLVAWSEHSHPRIIYSKTTDFKSFERDPRGYANWGVGDDGIVSARREGDRLYLFSDKYVHEMALPVAANQPPSTPGPLSAADVDQTQATINWGKSTDPDNDPITYELQYRKEDLSTSWTATANATAPSLALSALEPDTSYRVRIRSNDGQNASNWNLKANLFTTQASEAGNGSGAIGEGFIGEVGGIENLTDQPTIISLQRSYADPVVFAQSPSSNGSDQVVVRVTDVQADQFTIRLQEPSHLDGTHGTETVSFAVLEAGTWQLPGGLGLQVGTVDTNASVGGSQLSHPQWQQVTLPPIFSEIPVVLSQVQTANDPSFVKTRQRDANRTRFQVALEGEEADTNPHGTETIGYLAIETGAGKWGQINFETFYDQIPDNEPHPTTIRFQQNFARPPHFLASLATYHGDDPAALRYMDRESDSVKVRVEEDTTWDSEQQHGSESIGYLALASDGLLAGAPLNGSVIGEVATIDALTTQPQTVVLRRSYVNPVVFAQSPSSEGAEPVVVRVSNVQSDQFTLYLQEPSNLDGSHAGETVAYAVFESGQWQLSNGAMLEVGTAVTNAAVGNQLANPQWHDVSLSAPFSDVPVVLSQVQTQNNTPLVKTRHRDTATAGFQIALEGEEAATTAHGSETIGYLAVDPGAGRVAGITYEALTTSLLVGDGGANLTFNPGFAQPPHFLASLSTHEGSDPTGLRYDSLTGSSVYVRAEEDTTLDEELSHAEEAVSYLALGDAGLLTGQPIAGQAVGEVGRITDLTHEPRVVLLKRVYQNPVVIAQAPSYKGAQPVVVRTTDVQSDRFTLYLQEPSNLDAEHIAETVTYLVVETGQWHLPDGTKIQAGSVETSASTGPRLTHPQWQSMTFDRSFSTTPVVLSQIQSDNNTSYAKLRHRHVTSNGFDLSLEGEEAATTAHGRETIGYLAMDSGSGFWGGLAREGFSTAPKFDDTGATLRFTQRFEQPPNFLASMATYEGADPAALRYDALTKASVSVLVEEEQTLDEEVAHTPEAISYLALDGHGMLLALNDRLKGDVNHDGAADNLDITSFIHALSVDQADQFTALVPGGCFTCADLTMDGIVNNLDITPFLVMLGGQASTAKEGRRVHADQAPASLLVPAFSKAMSPVSLATGWADAITDNLEPSWWPSR